MVAFRKNKTIRDTLVRAKVSQQAWPSIQSHEGTSARITLSSAETITNTNTGVTVKTLNRESSIHDCNVVYAAVCTNCRQIYVGHTIRKLYLRFTGHRSDVIHYPDRCELPQHFYTSPYGCSFDNGVEIHILQKNLASSRAARETEEDKWISKL